MTTEQEQAELTNVDIVRAATNDSTGITVQLGDRTFPIKDLSYDSYVRFFSLLQPLLEMIAGKLAPSLQDHATGITSEAIIRYCSDSLPEMVCIVCEQTDPTITIQEVKELGKTPFNLAKIVIKQIEQNRVIADVSDFFVQVLPLLTKATVLQKK